MAVNNEGEHFVQKVTCSASDQMISLVQSRHAVSLIADGDCFVNFDKAVTATGRFLIKANTQQDFVFDGGVSVVHYLADSATPALYIEASTKW